MGDGGRADALDKPAADHLRSEVVSECAVGGTAAIPPGAFRSHLHLHSVEGRLLLSL